MRPLKLSFMACVALLLTLVFIGSTVTTDAAWRYKKSKSRISAKSSKKGKRYAKHRSKRRHRVACNTTAGRQQALAFLQSSRDLSTMAGVEYHSDPNIQLYVDNDEGELNDDELAEEELAALEQSNDGKSGFTADAATLRKMWLAYIRTVDSTEYASALEENFIAGTIGKRELMTQILNWIGTPYYYGGTQRSGIDCSAFTRAIYRASGDIELPRSAAMQSTVGEHVRSREELRFGDLIFFNTRSAVYVSHVGVYLGDGLFAHASSRYGVTVSSLSANYYQGRFLGGKRLRTDDMRTLATNAKNYSSLDVRRNANADE